MHYIKKYEVVLVREKSFAYDTKTIGGPKDAENFFLNILKMGDMPSEQIWIMYLSARHDIIGCEMISKGGIAGAPASPRDVFKGAMLSNAHGIIIAHNHPSGSPKPSQDDIETTKVLLKASEILQIELIDHLVVGNGCAVSLKEMGVI